MPSLTKCDVDYREFGDPEGSKLLLCVPHISANEHSFDALIPFFEQHDDCKLIVVDLLAYGASGCLRQQDGYKMSHHLRDLTALISHIHASHKRKVRNLFLMGAGMGGILSMHLAVEKNLRIKGVILNDVALTISWKSIYKYFRNLDPRSAKSKVAALSKSRKIEPESLLNVQLPQHLDLDYRLNLRGIHFHRLIREFDQPMMFLRGENSEICTLLDQIEFTQYAKNGSAIEVQSAAHPVDYKPEVLRAIADFLRLQKTSYNLCDVDSEVDHQDLRVFKKLKG